MLALEEGEIVETGEAKALSMHPNPLLLRSSLSTLRNRMSLGVYHTLAAIGLIGEYSHEFLFDLRHLTFFGDA
ncbi:hypothetical protein SMC7_06965 [Candidatus Cryosericum terrychapinii]|uniref:Uncharacterized protein n=1 Tax=Candidatus Cryosericum terrychapinii TaxID=2290919 RepID=A0A398D380_9BACT|nr:hypothetical protein SMC7_06965 [Candidatus Cryosericum terrychapinii]